MNQMNNQTIADYEQEAVKVADESVFQYIQKTAGEGKTFSNNLSVFGKYSLVPSYLSGQGNPETILSVQGRLLSSPIMIAPTAWHQLFSPKGEAATCRATKRFGTNFIISSFSTLDFHEIASELSNTWYQLLMYKSEDLMMKYIRKAEKAGVAGIVLTIDAPTGCSMCKSQGEVLKGKPALYPIADLPLLPVPEDQSFNSLDEYYVELLDPSKTTWQYVAKIIAETSVPVILKGVLSQQDAIKAIEVGASGIIVSNHGGRQLDGVITTLDALEKIAKPDIVSNIEVYMDGGIRSGADVFKAIAFGARAVMIGRPTIYGLAVAGEEGVLDILQILHNELVSIMQFTGCGGLEDITRDKLFSDKFLEINSHSLVGDLR